MTFQLLPPTDDFLEFGATNAEPLHSRPATLGVRLVDGGVDVVVAAGQATRVDICFFDSTRPLAYADTLVTAEPPAPSERRYTLKQGLYGRWTGHIPGIQAGAVYGFRAYGPWEPERGFFYNPAKVMLDPYARQIAQMPVLHSSLYAHQVDEELKPLPGKLIDNQDSSRYAALAMVCDLPEPADHIHVPWGETIIYEAHVVGLTKQLDAVPENLRGTYAGAAHPATIQHLKELGVTTLELLPIYSKMSEPFLTFKGLTNYWGYNTLNYFVPEPTYATKEAQAAGPEAVLDEVRGMVSILHQAGIEVVLDVVYNHTNEAGIDGPSTSFRGLDHLGYYRYNSFNPGELKDTTGCGNSLDFRRPNPVALTLDSLRYWVQYVGIDGFRFDLAVTLGREGDSFSSHHPLFAAALSDPILCSVKLINEPWDLGMNGWQTGNFAAGTADWNDRFRDALRSFWVTEPAAIAAGGSGSDTRDLATRLSGSADLFAHGRTRGGRGVFASVNFVTAHDGFSMWDLVSFNGKHNEANLEGNRDGSDGNRSWNHGVEGFAVLADEPDSGKDILAARRQTVRNLLGTLILSAGTPMLRAGDELLKSQDGNNNAYCQDTPISWLDWRTDEDALNLNETVSYLLHLRKKHTVLRPEAFADGTPQGADALKDLEWFDALGETMPIAEWFDPSARILQMLRSGRAHPDTLDRDALVALNGSLDPVEITLPTGRGTEYELMWSSAWEHPRERDGAVTAYAPGDTWEIPALSLALFFA